MTEPRFDVIAEAYEAMIDWAKRLKLEAPFYRDLFEKHSVRRVLDAACGSGRHATMFHDWGIAVEGADLSPVMLDIAKGRCGENENLRWTRRGFDEPFTPSSPFDAVICVGNSLALSADLSVVKNAFSAMLAAMRPGGALVIHILNLARLSDGPCVWQKCNRALLSEGERIIVKGVHRTGERGYVELLVIDPTGAAPLRTEFAPLLTLAVDELRRIVEERGASEVKFYGDYDGRPFDPKKSVDLIMTAVKS